MKTGRAYGRGSTRPLALGQTPPCADLVVADLVVVIGLITRSYLLALISVVLFAAIFVLVLFVERPGLGTGHLFYLAILFAALAGGPLTGALGGVVASGLYSTAIWLNPHTPSASLLTTVTSIRLVMFVIVGAAFGWFATRNRAALTRLQTLAERDHLTRSSQQPGLRR